MAGFGGYTKHVSIGLGGGETIQRSHFLSAVYGIEQTLGRVDAPVRQLLDRGFDRFLEPRCRVLFALTVVEGRHDGPVLRGVFAGEGGTRSSGGAAFRAAAALSASVNIETLATPFQRCVAYLDPDEYRSTWLANKAIYRTRLAMADGGELVRRRAGRVALRRGPRRRRADPAARLPRARGGAAGDGGRPRAGGEPRGGRASDPRLDRGALHRHLRARAGALARRRRGRRLPLPGARRGARAVPARHGRHSEPGARAVADLRADRYIEASPVGLDLYRGVADLPIVSPHGHIDVRLLADPGARLDPPGRLFVTADHYVVRMLYSQGVPLERCGLGGADVDDRDVWQLLADNVHLFALTPTGLWLRETLATVFGIEEQLDSASAEAIYARVEEQLATAGVRPAGAARPVPGRVPVDDRPRRLVARRAPRARRRAARLPHPADLSSRRGRRARRTPAGAPRCPSSRPRPTARSATTRRSSTCWPSGARRSRRSARPRPITQRRAPTPRGSPSSEASALFAAALAGAVSHADARRFEAHMLNEFARMSCDDGLVMQLHVGSLRDHNGPLAARFGRDIGADIPVATDWTRGLRPLLEACGNDPGFAVILFTLDESTYSRELAPLAGHYPAVLLGCPWWFHDSPAGIDRFLDRVTETAGAVQPRRLRRRRARPDRAPCAARPLAAPHVRLARAEGRRRLPGRGRGAPPRAGARLRARSPRVPAGT